MLKSANETRPKTAAHVGDLPPEEALAQLQAQLQLLEERSRAQLVARPLRGLIRLARADARRVGRDGLQTALLLGVAAVTALSAYVCAVAGAVIWVARHSDPAAAALMVAVAFGVLTVGALLLVGLLYRRERRWIAERTTIYQEAGSLLMRAVLGPRLGAVVAAIGEPEPQDPVAVAQAPAEASARTAAYPAAQPPAEAAAEAPAALSPDDTSPEPAPKSAS